MNKYKKKLLQDGKYVKEFTDGHIHFKFDYYALTFFQKAFSGNLQAVYSDGGRFPTKQALNIGCTTYIIVNAEGRVFEMHNSEWGGLEYLA